MISLFRAEQTYVDSADKCILKSLARKQLILHDHMIALISRGQQSAEGYGFGYNDTHSGGGSGGHHHPDGSSKKRRKGGGPPEKKSSSGGKGGRGAGGTGGQPVDDVGNLSDADGHVGSDGGDSFHSGDDSSGDRSSDSVSDSGSDSDLSGLSDNDDEGGRRRLAVDVENPDWPPFPVLDDDDTDTDTDERSAASEVGFHCYLHPCVLLMCFALAGFEESIVCGCVCCIAATGRHQYKAFVAELSGGARFRREILPRLHGTHSH